MLTRRSRRRPAFTRRDAIRLAVAASLLIATLGAILSVEILPTGFSGAIGDTATSNIEAPRTADFTSTIETDLRRQQARDRVPPQYDYTAERGREAADRQGEEFDRAMLPVDSAFGALLTPESRAEALALALPDLSSPALEIIQGMEPLDWTALRGEMARVLDAAQSAEVRDTQLADARAGLRSRVSTRFPADERSLAAEILAPFLQPNSTYNETLTATTRDQAAAQVDDVTYTFRKGEILVAEGQRVDAALRERLQFYGLLDPQPDPAKYAGWFLLSALLVGLLLGWFWRFRPEFWNRSNVLLLVGLVIVLGTLAVKVTGDRSVLPYFVPTAAIGLLLAVLLDSGAALIVTAVLSIIAATVTSSVELGTYVFLGGLAGIIVVRRGERVANFVQAGLAMAVVNLAVVTIFTLLGERDLTGAFQLWGAAVAAAAGSAVAALGTFAALGNLFGITTSFQLLELANPSQPLLRRLLLETPGTYHHSLMVGNLGERAAEAVGADPLLTRAAAYYHDIGKLANPLAFIENQSGTANVHDELTPEQSVMVLTSHVANGIDLAYRYKLPKAIISFIPQHHGTALMSYFYAKAKEQAIEAAGARPGTPQADEAAATVPAVRFRHGGPKPQSREAAILMLADSVEASVRSLTSQDEPAIRAMVERIIRERSEDGQFDECDLTLRDLDLIREAFVAQLLGMYHRRIEYPQNKIVELESRRAAGAGGGGASA